MDMEKVERLIRELTDKLCSLRQEDGIWRGVLSSSAISTSVSLFALYEIDKEKYRSVIEAAAKWLEDTMCDDGSWGDSVDSPSNPTATLLSFAALHAVGHDSPRTRQLLTERFGGYSDDKIIEGVLKYYGKDLTFSVPILVMCAMTGVIHSWDKIPSFPFELAVLPQRFFRFLNLPVVSYAIPALIAVGILRFKKGKRGLVSGIRQRFIPSCLKVLTRLQPEDGGFLEAAPLTAFVSMCMSGAGFREHPVTQKAAQFLVNTVRADGSWPIDTDLSGWLTSLSIRVLGDDLPNRDFLLSQLKNNQTKAEHPFTGAKAGGWGWSDLSGSVPDGDDTSGALIALHHLTHGVRCKGVKSGVKWLMALQNNDGGMPTFCKGWGKLPFDRSSADITAHALLALGSWRKQLPAALQIQVENSEKRMLAWLETHQAEDGSWTPLWFGDQDSDDEASPVYGTATALDYLAQLSFSSTMTQRGIEFLLQSQNEDGGWGGKKGVESKATLTGKALSALAGYADTPKTTMERAVDYLLKRHEEGTLLKNEPIGLYFARLWYSEELYPVMFVLDGLKKYKSLTPNPSPKGEGSKMKNLR
ncbi:MAG: squalene--hopene cyclase [Bacteroidaceae bacterium]|nr:squalene--hopene cyclase [Bacteroidaceae bacterium]